MHEEHGSKKKQESPEDVYKNLKQDLLSGTASPGEAISTLLSLDQAVSGREASVTNLVFLYDPEVKGFIDKYPDVRRDYLQLLTLTEFHVAQRLAFGGDNTLSIEHLEKALNSTHNENWMAYVKGTLLYMQGKEIPEEIISQVTWGPNPDILRSLNKGLKERGAPSYKDDYHA